MCRYHKRNAMKKQTETISDFSLLFYRVIGRKSFKPLFNKVFVRMFLRFRIMRYGTGYAIPHFLSRE